MLSMKSLKLGISTKIENTDQRWGLKNTKEKVVYERQLGKRSKVGMKKCREEKIVYIQNTLLTEIVCQGHS